MKAKRRLPIFVYLEKSISSPFPEKPDQLKKRKKQERTIFMKNQQREKPEKFLPKSRSKRLMISKMQLKKLSTLKS
jgi:hypothetical protein